MRPLLFLIAVLIAAPAYSQRVFRASSIDVEQDDRIDQHDDQLATLSDRTERIETSVDKLVQSLSEMPAAKQPKPYSYIIKMSIPGCIRCTQWDEDHRPAIERRWKIIEEEGGARAYPSFWVVIGEKRYFHEGMMTLADLWSIYREHTGEQRAEPQAERDVLKSRLPACASPEVTQAFSDPATLWYTSDEMTSAYQTDSRVDARATFHDPHYDLSGGADQKRANGNANMEFPWQHPGGTDGARTLKGMRLPVVDGERLPVVAWKEYVSHQRRPNFGVNRLSWRFPRGTQFFEVLYVNDDSGKPWPFSIRMRQRASDYWDTSVFRPIRDRAELAAKNPYQVSPSNRVTSRLVSTHPLRTAFDVSATWESLPSMEPDTVRDLLSEPFVDCTGVDWSDGVAEPTSRQSFSIVPQEYNGTIVGNTPDSCASCHEHVGEHVSTFDAARDWYGFVRGDDGIFSFLPVERSSIAGNGAPLPVRLRQDFVREGMLTMQDSEPGGEYYAPLATD